MDPMTAPTIKVRFVVVLDDSLLNGDGTGVGARNAGTGVGVGAGVGSGSGRGTPTQLTKAPGSFSFRATQALDVVFTA